MKKISPLSVYVGFISLLASCSIETVPPQAILPVPNEHPAIFNPTTDFNPVQWVQVIKDAGMKALILTCKHHDGFCLWRSAYTGHSVENSPFMDGKGDIVKTVSEACRQHGLKFGIYLSPWDRNSALYASPDYITYYRKQLRELLTGYGEIFEVWFDGANGGDGFYGGAKESRQIDNKTYYDWTNTHAIVRELSPKAMIFSDAGPDIRWCGNENGFVGDPNWNLISVDTLYPGKAHINELLNHGDENGLSWIPAEVDVSIRPGWFYHEDEDDKVRTPDNLFRLYMQSVGRGANLLLNIPPDRRGLLHENDIQALKGWKKLLDKAFAVNLADGATTTANSYRGKSKLYEANNVTDGDKETYWATDDDVLNAFLEIDLGKPQKINYVIIQEYIRLGQRIKEFNIEIWKNNGWIPATSGTTIGYKRIAEISSVETSKLRINFTDAKACPVISNVEVY
jgi:alpha-L-fucosidase